jgi:DNA-binding NarL/FixJ family response regulator
MMSKILIADDDARMRRMIRQVVADLAGAVYEAANAGEAIDICVAERPDWVLLDLRMGPGDGLRALSEIRARAPETRVIIVSQYDDPGLRAKALRAGACAYLLKENLHELPAILTGLPVETEEAPCRAQEHSTLQAPRPPPNRVRLAKHARLR